MGRANRTGRPPILTAPFPVLIAASILLASCANTPQGATPKVYTAKLTFASFNPFTGPDASFGPEMTKGCEPAVRVINQAGGVLGHQVQCLVV